MHAVVKIGAKLEPGIYVQRQADKNNRQPRFQTESVFGDQTQADDAAVNQMIWYDKIIDTNGNENTPDQDGCYFFQQTYHTPFNLS